MDKFFPVNSKTSCKLKWGWSTLYLNAGLTASCHRASFSNLTVENFSNFHNTDTKIQARRLMIEGKWPVGGCEYCQNIEQAGGTSDRQLHNAIPGLYPTQSDEVTADPALLEVFFNNTCNLSCLYCSPELSSSIDQENHQFGNFEQEGVRLVSLKQKSIGHLEPEFWKWMETNFITLKRFHFLGGEPFYQKQFATLLDFIDSHPNPNCEFSIITNLMVNTDIIVNQIDRIKKLVVNRKLKRLDITASIDCWGSEQEYVRYGINLTAWLSNFTYLLNQKWIKLNINQTISGLTIKTMPELLINLASWRKTRSVGHYFSVTEPGPSYLRPNIFGKGVFTEDFTKILSLMPTITEDNKLAFNYMSGIAQEIETHAANKQELTNLFIFLNEKDRRRKTNWRETFPWLVEVLDVV